VLVGHCTTSVVQVYVQTFQRQSIRFFVFQGVETFDIRTLSNGEVSIDRAASIISFAEFLQNNQ
jgi:hypothetical protein